MIISFDIIQFGYDDNIFCVEKPERQAVPERLAKQGPGRRNGREGPEDVRGLKGGRGRSG